MDLRPSERGAPYDAGSPKSYQIRALLATGREICMRRQNEVRNLVRSTLFAARSASKGIRRRFTLPGITNQVRPAFPLLALRAPIEVS